VLVTKRWRQHHTVRLSFTSVTAKRLTNRFLFSLCYLSLQLFVSGHTLVLPSSHHLATSTCPRGTAYNNFAYARPHLPLQQYNGQRGAATGFRVVHGHSRCECRSTSTLPTGGRFRRFRQSVSFPGVSATLEPETLETDCALQTYSVEASARSRANKCTSLPL
jgi:hypothetical protein